MAKRIFIFLWENIAKILNSFLNFVNIDFKTSIQNKWFIKSFAIKKFSQKKSLKIET